MLKFDARIMENIWKHTHNNATRDFPSTVVVMFFLHTPGLLLKPITLNVYLPPFFSGWSHRSTSRKTLAGAADVPRRSLSRPNTNSRSEFFLFILF